MFDDALTQLFNTHQDKMSNRKAFYGIVKDSFPTELMRANLVLMLYDMKIHEAWAVVDNIKGDIQLKKPFSSNIGKQVAKVINVVGNIKKTL